jgi:hypothetical protein
MRQPIRDSLTRLPWSGRYRFPPFGAFGLFGLVGLKRRPL